MPISTSGASRYAVRRSNIFEKVAAEILGSARRVDEAIAAAEWAIAKNPRAFPLVQGLKTVRIIKTNPFPGMPALRIFFTVEDDGYCTLQYVEQADEPGEEED